jgi:hypothetical protein
MSHTALLGIRRFESVLCDSLTLVGVSWGIHLVLEFVRRGRVGCGSDEQKSGR